VGIEDEPLVFDEVTTSSVMVPEVPDVATMTTVMEQPTSKAGNITLETLVEGYAMTVLGETVKPPIVEEGVFNLVSMDTHTTINFLKLVGYQGYGNKQLYVRYEGVKVLLANRLVDKIPAIYIRN
jgi:hypothetical protein